MKRRHEFNDEDPVIKMILEDCGGHGRALEALYDALRRNVVDPVAQKQAFDIPPLDAETNKWLVVDEMVPGTTIKDKMEQWVCSLPTNLLNSAAISSMHAEST
jgi:hypothetical protein